MVHIDVTQRLKNVLIRQKKREIVLHSSADLSNTSDCKRFNKVILGIAFLSGIIPIWFDTMPNWGDPYPNILL
jgi:hypothetical protein